MRNVDAPNKGPLSWADHPVTELLRLAGPMTLSMLPYSVMTLVGTLFVAQLGSAQLAGVGLAGVTLFTLLCFPIGLFGGAKVLVAQAVGAGDEIQARAHATTMVLASLVFGLVWVGLGWSVGVVLPRFTASCAGLPAHRPLELRRARGSGGGAECPGPRGSGACLPLRRTGAALVDGGNSERVLAFWRLGAPTGSRRRGRSLLRVRRSDRGMALPPLSWALSTPSGRGAYGGWLALCIEMVVVSLVCWARLGSLRWLK